MDDVHQLQWNQATGEAHIIQCISHVCCLPGCLVPKKLRDALLPAAAAVGTGALVLATAGWWVRRQRRRAKKAARLCHLLASQTTLLRRSCMRQLLKHTDDRQATEPENESRCFCSHTHHASLNLRLRVTCRQAASLVYGPQCAGHDHVWRSLVKGDSPPTLIVPADSRGSCTSHSPQTLLQDTGAGMARPARQELYAPEERLSFCSVDDSRWTGNSGSPAGGGSVAATRSQGS